MYMRMGDEGCVSSEGKYKDIKIAYKGLHHGVPVTAEGSHNYETLYVQFS